MAYPYKKMTSQDCDYIRSVTAPDRVWVGEEIASEYYRDEMPEYGVYQPDLYVEVVNKEEVSAIMAYAYKENIPVVCRGAGTGLLSFFQTQTGCPEPLFLFYNNIDAVPSD